MPLQGTFAFGAAPAAEVLTGLQHPAQPQLTQGFAADAEQLTGLSCADPDPLAGGRDLGFHQLPASCAQQRWSVSTNQLRR